jgi:hypothetical protein
VIGPLADAGDDVAELWLARWLADGDHIDELRRRAATGSCHALHSLAWWLADREQMDELRGLVAEHAELLSGWVARQDGARRRLDRWRARVRERAAAGDQYAQRFLAEWAG